MTDLTQEIEHVLDDAPHPDDEPYNHANLETVGYITHWLSRDEPAVGRELDLANLALIPAKREMGFVSDYIPEDAVGDARAILKFEAEALEKMYNERGFYLS